MSESILNGQHVPIKDIPRDAVNSENEFSLSDIDDDNSFEKTAALTVSVDGDSDVLSEEPASKRRKVLDGGSHVSASRAPSPPWKKITADGPTTFLENGRRRSGRTNIVPLEQQSYSGKRQTRAAYDKATDWRARPSPNGSTRLKPEAQSGFSNVTVDQSPRRGPGRPPKVRTGEHLKPKHGAVSSPSNRRVSSRVMMQQSPLAFRNESSTLGVNKRDVHDTKPRLSSPPLTLQKVKFRVALPQPSILTPANIPSARKYANFREFLDRDPLEPFAGQDILSPDQIKKEARSRQPIYEAQRLGQSIGGDNADASLDKQSEPRRQFSHHDHLLGHVFYFRSLLRQEAKDHKKRAEQIAYEAKRYVEEKLKKGRVKTAEELAEEQIVRTRIQYRHVVKDIDRLWSAVQAAVKAIRLRQFEEEQQAKIKNHLNRVLERTDEMLARREDSEMTSDIEIGTASSTEEDEDEDEESNSEVMSTSSSDTETDDGHIDPDENLTAEQLRMKYEDMPQLSDVDTTGETDREDIQSNLKIEDSDPDVEMDSEFDSDESDEDIEDGNVDVESEGEAEDSGLLSLFLSKEDLAAIIPENAQDTVVEPTGMHLDSFKNENHQEDKVAGIGDQSEPRLNKPVQVIARSDSAPSPSDISKESIHQGEIADNRRTASYQEEVTTTTTVKPTATALDATNLIEDTPSQDVSVRTSPDTQATKQSEPDSASSPDAQVDYAPPVMKPDEKTTIRTSIPSLLRGTLREYQHEGLDWLANLYANGRSGILADEMGLGKTIQSIALLAHLAVEYEVWGPHLIVVPTSVMLNWEMEFKKFLPGFKILTYYGTVEERKQKRRGWMANDSFNVCITSYQLVLQDANSFKRRRWHYMILDEAHNIKNFRSERWQTMMTFNTRARLLLTGTPLQNNLTELWSLLFFLHYGQDGEEEDEAFAGLKEWSEWFKRPVESILEHGRQVLDQEDKDQVAKLHKVIRPFLLRRLKADVEKQMPAKYEHVEMCRLSKRQRQLYDGFMSRAQTKETLASGNYLSIINALMQLRKVCNHPDLFETRPVNTSFAMPKSVAAECEIKDLLFRRKLFSESPLDEIDLDFLQLVPISNEKISLIENIETVRRHAYHPFKTLRDSQWLRVNRHVPSSGQRRRDILGTLENVGRQTRLQDIDRTMYYEAYRHHQRPIYGRGLLERLGFGTTYDRLSLHSTQCLPKQWGLGLPLAFQDLVQSTEDRSLQMQPFIKQYACVTPAVVTADLNRIVVTDTGADKIQCELATNSDPFHQARTKLAIAFPDKRLLQYDCGKLQRLDKLLRKLQAGGHRALIFTQMTKVLDILEQFLNIHGHRYLRLDGATKIEQRQILTDRFNNDARILCFILSSRSGGLGINLTGADTVIFYDLDWNPAMDRQCTDRAHRIGQTRDVHIYRFVSEHTIESNILRKANQKQMLDDVVIQDGGFTTDYMNKISYRDMLDNGAEDDVAGAAMDRVLGNDKSAATAFEHAEDQEDVSAAKVAAKEVQHADDGDFEDGNAMAQETEESGMPGLDSATDVAVGEADQDPTHHIDDYLLKLQTFLLKDMPLAPPKDKGKRGRKRGDEHRKRRPR